MIFEVDPEFEGDLADGAVALAQQAIDATATAYTQDAGIDVDERLAAELRSRGIAVPADDEVAQLARDIRSGHHVSVV